MRVGSFRIRAETQRYFRPKISYERQFCITCPNENQEVECETHYLFLCSAYDNLRHTWLNKFEKPESIQQTLFQLHLMPAVKSYFDYEPTEEAHPL